ncbi:hypothetical protein [Streptomyces albicerus]|uniref:hypothetical protein n=1 Tax=Streptomyces albicerus TaxID=2569859 RepID=UPI00124B4959|nr:hypothetical protein [Streptomyces albicerus]
MAARKTTARRKATVPEPVKCEPCNGTGEVARTVRVGRKQRVVGQQSGICLACFGTGEAAD